MSLISKNAEQRYLLDGQPYNAPIKWEDVVIQADYVNDSIQPSLTIDEFEFTLEARDVIKQWIAKGLAGTGPGIFEGMPFQLNVFNNKTGTADFDSYIDFTDGYQDLLEDGKLKVGTIKRQGIENFFDQVDGTTYGYLEEIGAVGAGDYVDVKYLVEKKFNLLEIIMAAVMLYTMTKELINAIDTTITAVANAIGHLSGGISGSIGSALFIVLKAVLLILYVALLLIAVIELSKQFFQALVSPERTHKTILLKRALEIVANHFGYQFVTNIEELDVVLYLPSNPRNDDKDSDGMISNPKGTPTGIPNVVDYGYLCSEMFELAKRLFDAQMSIVGNIVYFLPANDNFWIQQSTYVLPDAQLVNQGFNTDELKSDRIISFEIDLNDDWTIDDYKGTAYEIRTRPNFLLRKDAVLLKGLDEIDFNCCLPTRKDELNALEEILKGLAGFIDGVVSTFFGNSDFQGAIENRVGMMKQSQNWHSKPKLLYAAGGKLPTNHKQLWNAKILYDKYIKERSFVLDNFNGQKEVFENIEVPFGLEDYKILTTNPYFTVNGNQAKMTKFAWTVGKDKAKLSWWVKKPYTVNLTEEYIEPS
jgi:hypothetical protein